jgi:hypothetical protein
VNKVSKCTHSINVKTFVFYFTLTYKLQRLALPGTVTIRSNRRASQIVAPINSSLSFYSLGQMFQSLMVSSELVDKLQCLAVPDEVSP